MEKNFEAIIQQAVVNHPLREAYINKNRYWKDFLEVDKRYHETLNQRDYLAFLAKSQLDCKIEVPQYLQFASEVTVVNYILRHYSDFQYEPKYHLRKNPECSFQYEGRTVNVEVKCPNLLKRIEQEQSDGVHIFAAERFPDKDSYESAVQTVQSEIKVDKPNEVKTQVVDRLDNKLKDFLISAHQKFPDSNHNCFNILVISLEILSDMDEWYSYIFGDTGVFSSKSFVSEDYSNVDAILLTNIQSGHTSDKVNLEVNCWEFENYLSLLLFNPQKEKNNELSQYYWSSAIHLFGSQTCSFFYYLYTLDQICSEKFEQTKKACSCLSSAQKREQIEHLYLQSKIEDLQIITKWIEDCKRPHSSEEYPNMS